jgi:hypothetical protein
VDQTEFARRFQSAGHWLHLDLGDHWLNAGIAFTAAYPSAARRAFDWSRFYLEAYNRAWSEHLPASRWDGDAGDQIMKVIKLQRALPDAPPGEPPLPAWVYQLLAGNWPIEDIPPHPSPPFDALLPLLEVCRAVK